MAQALITPDVIAKESLRLLTNKLVLGRTIDTTYRNEFAKKGEQIQLRRPVRFTIRTGATYSAQDVEEAKPAFAITEQAGVDFQFTTRELTTTIEMFSKRYLAPAVATIAQRIETTIANQYKKFYWYSGTPGTTPSTFLHLRDPGELLTLAGAPLDDRFGAHHPGAATKLADGLKAVYVQDISRDALQEATFGRYAGLTNMETVSIPTHTVGAHAGTPLVDGADQDTTYALSKTTWTQSLVTNGWTSDVTDVLLEGDVFTIAAVNAVNPMTRQSTGNLQTFVVRADADSGASTGPATLTISPPIITSGAYQTVDAAPANDAAITVKGTASTQYKQSLCYQRDAISLATFDLEMPEEPVFKARAVDEQSGWSIRVLKVYDYTGDTQPCRLDVLYACDAIYNQLGCRLTS